MTTLQFPFILKRLNIHSFIVTAEWWRHIKMQRYHPLETHCCHGMLLDSEGLHIPLHLFCVYCFIVETVCFGVRRARVRLGPAHHSLPRPNNHQAVATSPKNVSVKIDSSFSCLTLNDNFSQSQSCQVWFLRMGEMLSCWENILGQRVRNGFVTTVIAATLAITSQTFWSSLLVLPKFLSLTCRRRKKNKQPSSPLSWNL